MRNSLDVYTVQEREFTPHQPYLEFNNGYRSFFPSEDDILGHIVWEVYQVDHYDRNKTLAFPDLCADIMAFYTNSQVYCFFMGGTREMRSMMELPFISEVHTIFGVKLRTGMLGNLFRCDTKDVGAGVIDAEDALWKGDFIVEQLACARDFTSRWHVIENYLRQRISHNYQVNKVVNYITKDVIDCKGKISIKDLEEQTGYCGRYLRKMVNDSLGISIKQLCDITRFQWMYHVYHKMDGRISLSELAFQVGYYDQSHMNQCCKKLTGQLPKHVVKLYEGSSLLS